MKNQVLSIQQMHHLQELGIDTSNASMFYVPKLESKDEYCLLNVKPNHIIPFIPTFTLQDIIELLPDDAKVGYEWAELSISNSKVSYLIECDHDGYYPYKEFESSNGESVLELCYQMLCWCAEIGFLNNNKTE